MAGQCSPLSQETALPCCDDPLVDIYVSSWLFLSLKTLAMEQTRSTGVLVSIPSSSHGPDISFPSSSFRRFRLERCLLAPAQQSHIYTSSDLPQPTTSTTGISKHPVCDVSELAWVAQGLDGWWSWVGTRQRSVPAANFSSTCGGLVLPLGAGQARCRGP